MTRLRLACATLLVLSIASGCSANDKSVRLTQALCRVNAVGQPILVPLAAGIATAVAPGAAGSVVLATQLDAQAHAAVQAACKGMVVEGAAVDAAKPGP